MFLNFLNKRWNSIIFRLTFLYTCIFAAFILVIFVIIYWLLALYFDKETDQWLLGEASELRSDLETPNISEETIQKKINEDAISEKNFMFCALTNRQGKILFHSTPGEWKELLHRNVPVAQLANRQQIIESFTIRNHGFRACFLPLAKGRVLLIIASIEENARILDLLTTLFFASYLLLTAFFWILVFFMLKNTLHPIHTMTEIARQISLKNLGQKIPVQNAANELGQLATTLNEMLARIDALLTEVREKNDILAHNLRTPISRIRLDAEVTLLRKRSTEEYKEAMANCLGECDRLLDMLNTMLKISEVEVGIRVADGQEIDLGQLLPKTIEIYSDMAEYQNILLTYDGDADMAVRGNFRLLQQAILNLLDNAIKYSTSGGRISIIARNNNDAIAITITNTGIGIAPDDLPLIFERFYRGNNSRIFPGSGLGLAFVKAVAKAHKGTVAVTSAVDQETIFTMTLPLARSGPG